MKQLAKSTAYIFLIAVAIFSCKKNEIIKQPALSISSNKPPIANAGADRIITLPVDSANLDGSGSSDPDNNISGYSWTKISGPLSFNFINSNAVQTQVANLVQGIYQFELKVRDAGGLFSKDTVQVTVKSASVTTEIIAVFVHCSSIIISVPNNEAHLNSNASTNKGGVLPANGFHWTQISGPNNASIANPDSANTAVGNLIKGKYSFRLTYAYNNLIDDDTAIVEVIEDTLTGKEFEFERQWMFLTEDEDDIVSRPIIRPDLFYYNPGRSMVVSIRLSDSAAWMDIPYIGEGYSSYDTYSYISFCHHEISIISPHHPLDYTLIGKSVKIRIRFP